MTKIIIAGGANSGKSTILEKLKILGYSTVPEAAEQIIAEEKRRGSGILPSNPDDALFYQFQVLVSDRQILLEEEHADEGLSFLDRSIIDGIAYSRKRNVKHPRAIDYHIERAGYARVYFLETLPKELYVNNGIRDETYEEALEHSHTQYRVYKESGLPLTHLPNTLGVEGRLETIITDVSLL